MGTQNQTTTQKEFNMKNENKNNEQIIDTISRPLPEPWDTPVDGEKLLNDLAAAYTKYVILPDHAASALALWTLYTYGYEHFDISPRLAITSPQKRCGKSTLLIALEILASKTLPTSNISTASIYRVIEIEKPTLLLDEADTFLKKNDDMRGVLNAGHRTGGRIIRTEYKGRTATPTKFECFAPCAIAAISKKAIPGTILDRSIIIPMRRKLTTENVAKLRIKDAEKELFNLTRQCVRFMNDNAELISSIRPDVPATLSSRGADNWEALLAIADYVSPHWGKLARNSAISLANMDNQDDDDTARSLQLLWDLREIFHEIGKDFISSRALCAELIQREEREWAEYGYRHEPIKPHQVARLLRDFGIGPKDKRINPHQTAKCYCLDDCVESFERYLPEKSRDTATMAETESDAVSVYDGKPDTINVVQN